MCGEIGVHDHQNHRSRSPEYAKAVRAVASANGANSIGLIIPCHRIIGSNGELIGYGGGLPVKNGY